MDNKKKKTTLVKTMQGIAAVVVVGILSVTSYAAVTGNLSLQNMGFLKASKNYSENETEANQADDTMDDVFTEVKSISIMQEISMDIKREESRKKKFEEISQTVGNKTIVVKEAANTNFSTIIKASIITEEIYDEYSKNEDEILDYNNFLVTQGNGDDISYEVYEDTNTYAITDDGNMFTVNDLYDYMSNQKDDKEFASITGGILGIVRDSKVLSYDQIVEKYGKDENLNQKVVKIQKNYTIKIGNRENGEDVKKFKLLHIKKEFLNDRNGEEEDLYNNVKWYKLENKKFVATSELGGTLEITSILWRMIMSRNMRMLLL